ncbi:MAG: hypothetical protein V2A54_09630 [Bacteroidota bacterium]
MKKRCRSFIIITTSIIVLVLTILILRFLGYYQKEDNGIIGFFGRLLNKTNTFELKCNNFDKRDIDIVWETENKSDTIIIDGELKNMFSYDYGPESFKIIYKGKLLAEDGVWSTNNNVPYDVKIDITKNIGGFLIFYTINQEIIEINLDPEGKEKFERTVKKLE